MDEIRHVLTVACDAPSAFGLFTEGMGGWWDPSYSPDPPSFTGVEVDGAVGGLVALVHGSRRVPFGTVTTWQPHARYAQTYWLGMDPDHPSEIGVEFHEVSGVCEVEFVHGGWTAANRGSGARATDWSHLLGLFANAAARL